MNLYIVATPIGNLGDITFRAIETLKKVDAILCEDTRITSRLLDHYQVKKPLISYHQQSGNLKVEKIIELLKMDKDLALVTDAGTPGISDPGGELIEKLRKNFAEGELKIIPVPGPTALTTLISVAGINLSRFVFLGFPPNKKGRETFFKKLLEINYPVCYYESPYRLIKNLELLKRLSEEANQPIRLVIGRELTKIFEEVKIGSVTEIFDYFSLNKNKIKGELVLIVEKLGKKS